MVQSIYFKNIFAMQHLIKKLLIFLQKISMLTRSVRLRRYYPVSMLTLTG